MYIQIPTFEVELEKRNKKRAENQRNLLEGSNSPLPKVFPYLVTNIIFTDKEIRIFVEAHPILFIRMGCVYYDGKAWTEEDALETAQYALELADKAESSLVDVKKVCLMDIERKKNGSIRKLVWNY